MMTKTTIVLAAALFLAVGGAAQAGDNDSHERQGVGFDFHVGPLGQPLGGSPVWNRMQTAYAPGGAYAYVPPRRRIIREW
jgi:hypothetical protein